MKMVSRITCACLIWAGPAGADVVVDWNQRAARPSPWPCVQAPRALSISPWSTSPCTMPSRRSRVGSNRIAERSQRRRLANCCSGHGRP